MANLGPSEPMSSASSEFEMVNHDEAPPALVDDASGGVANGHILAAASAAAAAAIADGASTEDSADSASTEDGSLSSLVSDTVSDADDSFPSTPPEVVPEQQEQEHPTGSVVGTGGCTPDFLRTPIFTEDPSTAGLTEAIVVARIGAALEAAAAGDAAASSDDRSTVDTKATRTKLLKATLGEIHIWLKGSGAGVMALVALIMSVALVSAVLFMPRAAVIGGAAPASAMDDKPSLERLQTMEARMSHRFTDLDSALATSEQKQGAALLGMGEQMSALRRAMHAIHAEAWEEGWAEWRAEWRDALHQLREAPSPPSATAQPAAPQVVESRCAAPGTADHRGCDSALHAAERALNVANDQVNELSARLAREQTAREAAELELRAAQDVAFELRGSASPRACEARLDEARKTLLGKVRGEAELADRMSELQQREKDGRAREAEVLAHVSQLQEELKAAERRADTSSSSSSSSRTASQKRKQQHPQRQHPPRDDGSWEELNQGARQVKHGAARCGKFACAHARNWADYVAQETAKWTGDHPFHFAENVAKSWF